MGASIVKWTISDPCLEFSESDSKLYTNFELCDEAKNHRHFKNILIYNSKKIMMTKQIPRKVYIF